MTLCKLAFILAGFPHRFVTASLPPPSPAPPDAWLCFPSLLGLPADRRAQESPGRCLPKPSLSVFRHRQRKVRKNPQRHSSWHLSGCWWPGGRTLPRHGHPRPAPRLPLTAVEVRAPPLWVIPDACFGDFWHRRGQQRCAGAPAAETRTPPPYGSVWPQATKRSKLIN